MAVPDVPAPNIVKAQSLGTDVVYSLMSRGNQWQTITQYTSVPSDCASRPSAATMRILCNTQNNHLFRHNRRRRSMTTYAAAGDAGAFNMTCHCQHIHGALSISRGIFRQIVKHATK